MGNHSMTLENWFYLKAYCTANGPCTVPQPSAREQNNVPAW